MRVGRLYSPGVEVTDAEESVAIVEIKVWCGEPAILFHLTVLVPYLVSVREGCCASEDLW